MKTASDFRTAAREALTGKWGLAVGVGVVASILGAGGNLPSFNVEIDLSASTPSTPIPPSTDIVLPSWETIQEAFSGILPFLFGFGAFILFFALVTGIAYFILSSIVGVGYAKFNLNLIDRRTATFGDLFAYFSPAWKRAAIANFLRALYIFLWTFLPTAAVFIPLAGLIAALSIVNTATVVLYALAFTATYLTILVVVSLNYAMTSYILAEDTERSASEVVSAAKELIRGHRRELFCLHLSFIGWDLLCSLFTFGIGYLWLTPYKKAAVADFYREISDTRPVPEEPEPLPEL